MQKTICKRVYDTDTAKQIQKYTYGHWGDSFGYEETLYQTSDGLYFIYVNGGHESQYPQEDILRLAKTKVNYWIKTH